MRLICAAILISLNVPGVCGGQESVSTLVWPSGDRLDGRLISADDGSVTWQSSVFSEPLQISVDALAGVRFPLQPVQPSADVMRVTMRNGDVILGLPVDLTADSMTLQTECHQTVVLKQSQIRSVRHRDDFGTVYSGPQGLAGWRHPVISSWDTPPGWEELPDGRLRTSRREGVMFLPLDFPEQCELEVELSSSVRPSFVLALGSQADGNFRLECRDSSIVAVSGTHSVEVLPLTELTRQIRLSLFMDRNSGRMTICSDDGKRLAEVTDYRPNTGKAGILVRNGDGSLTLDKINVARGNGADLHELQPGECRLHLADGSVVAGILTGMSDKGQTLQLSIDDRPTSIRLNNLRGLFFSAPDQVEKQPGNVRAFWNDGTTLSGRLVSIHDGSMTLQAESSDQPIVSALDRIQRIAFAESEASAGRADRLFYKGGSLSGNLQLIPAASQDSADQLSQPAPVQRGWVGWKPPGGKNFAMLSQTLSESGSSARILRGSRVSRTVDDGNMSSDVIYLTNDDILPCRLDAVTADSVTVSSPCFSQRVISADLVRAVELHREEQTGRTGFDDPGWTRIVGKADHQPESLTFRASEAVGHKDLLNGDVVRFRLAWGQHVSASMTLNLYTDLPSVYPEGTAISFDCRDNTICVRDGFSDAPRAVRQRKQDDVKAGGAATEESGPQFVEVHERSAQITILRQADKVRVSVDGQLAQAFDLKLKSSDSRGLLIRASIINISHGMSDSSAADAASQNEIEDPAVAPPNAVRISDFEVCDMAGGSIRQFIDESARQVTLSIPRFRRDDPPTHVLLAPNGDMVRGHLESIDQQSVSFRARQERIPFERSRVAAIIWLKSPRQQAPDPEPEPEIQRATSASESAAQVVLSSGFRLSLSPTGVIDGWLRGQSSVLGEAGVPADSIQELLIGHWARSASDKSFLRWIPQYAQDPDWAIPVDESLAQAARNQIGKTADDLTLPLLDGTDFRLGDHQNQVVVLEFWASWCGPCVHTMRDTMAAADLSGVQFVAINMDESPQIIRDFLRERNLTPLVARDVEGLASEQFHVSAMPHTIVLAPGNQIQAVIIGSQRTLGNDGSVAAEVRKALLLLKDVPPAGSDDLDKDKKESGQ